MLAKKLILKVVDENRNGAHLVKCPCCGQKLLSYDDKPGEADIVVKCRRCHTYISVGLRDLPAVATP